MDLTCYIIDDEFSSIEILLDYINATPDLDLLSYSTKPLLSLEEINNLKPALIFLDIEMPGLNGIQLKELFQYNPLVVFTTAHPGFAIEAFEIKAFDYLLKPISLVRFTKTIQKVKESHTLPPTASREKNYFFLKSENKGKIVRLKYDDINYIESNSNYIIVCTDEQKFDSYLTMKEFLKFVPTDDFTRIHKSFVINNSKINHIEGNQVVMTDKSTLPIGITFREHLFQLVSESLIKTSRR